MRKMILLPVLMFILAVSGCTSKGTDLVSLIETQDTLQYDLPTDVENFGVRMQIYEDKDGHEYFVLMNKEKAQLLFYDLMTTELRKTVQLEVEGPNGVGRAAGFFVKDFENIFIPNAFKFAVSIINSAGVLQKEIEFDSNAVWGIMANIGGSPLILDNKLYTIQNPHRDMETSAFIESPSEVSIDLTTQEVKSAPCLIPSAYKNDVFGKDLVDAKYLLESRCYDGNNLIYGYGASAELAILSPDFQQLSFKTINSKFISHLVIDVNQPNMEIEALQYRHCTEAAYGDVVYDPYRRLYYRFAYPETELDSEHGESLLDLVRYGRNVFSIIVMDEHMDIIGETLFPRNTFRSDMYFVCKDGFYISCNHYKNPNASEDLLQFVKFEVKKQ